MKYGWIVAAILALVLGVFWWQGSVADAELEKIRAENKIAFERIAEQIGSLQAENTEKQRLIDSLTLANAQLAGVNARLAGEVSNVRRQRDERVAEIPSLQNEQVVERTLEVLKLEAPEVRATADSLIVFTRPAAGRNLEALEDWRASVLERELQQQRIGNLEEQLKNDLEIIAQQKEIIDNKDAEILAVTERGDRRVAELEQEVKAEKSKARKRTLAAAVGGVIVGAVLVLVGM